MRSTRVGCATWAVHSTGTCLTWVGRKAQFYVEGVNGAYVTRLSPQENDSLVAVDGHGSSVCPMQCTERILQLRLTKVFCKGS